MTSLTILIISLMQLLHGNEFSTKEIHSQSIQLNEGSQETSKQLVNDDWTMLSIEQLAASCFSKSFVNAAAQDEMKRRLALGVDDDTMRWLLTKQIHQLVAERQLLATRQAWPETMPVAFSWFKDHSKRGASDGIFILTDRRIETELVCVAANGAESIFGRKFFSHIPPPKGPARRHFVYEGSVIDVPWQILDETDRFIVRFVDLESPYDEGFLDVPIALRIPNKSTDEAADILPADDGPALWNKVRVKSAWIRGSNFVNLEFLIPNQADAADFISAAAQIQIVAFGKVRGTVNVCDNGTWRKAGVLWLQVPTNGQIPPRASIDIHVTGDAALALRDTNADFWSPCERIFKDVVVGGR